MAVVTITHTYQAPKAKVFAVFADIGSVHEISSGIESSKALNDKTGLGGVRECVFNKKSGIHEEVTKFKKNDTIQFSGVKFWGIPMKHMVATFNFKEIKGATTVNCEMDFNMKFGLLMNPIAKGMNRKAIKDMLVGAEKKL